MESCRPIRIVDIDGSVKEYLPPLNANEILLQHPDRFIYNSQDLMSCNFKPISPTRQLMQGKLYFLVSSALQTKDLLPLASKLIAGMNKRVSLEPSMDGVQEKNRLMESINSDFKGRRIEICDTQQSRTAYKKHLLQRCKMRSWRPELGTIDESYLYVSSLCKV
ncbi:hypothetical protein SUGI_0010420 [Cryptomeria japonica]|nr:hypothetical protein SUGI_0010420 [Cryptomeria japonica]